MPNTALHIYSTCVVHFYSRSSRCSREPCFQHEQIPRFDAVDADVKRYSELSGRAFAKTALIFKINELFILFKEQSIKDLTEVFRMNTNLIKRDVFIYLVHVIYDVIPFTNTGRRHLHWDLIQSSYLKHETLKRNERKF